MLVESKQIECWVSWIQLSCHTRCFPPKEMAECGSNQVTRLSKSFWQSLHKQPEPRQQGRETERKEWVGGKRKKLGKNEQKDREREWKRASGTFCYMCLQSIAPPLQAQHSPCRTSIINQSESRPLAPASLLANQISEHSVNSHLIT